MNEIIAAPAEAEFTLQRQSPNMHRKRGGSGRGKNRVGSLKKALMLGGVERADDSIHAAVGVRGEEDGVSGFLLPHMQAP